MKTQQVSGAEHRRTAEAAPRALLTPDALSRARNAIVLSAIADALEKTQRMTEGDLRYIVIDDVMAKSWAKSIRTAIEGLGEIDRLKMLLTRYRDETPIGHQPPMIANVVDSVLGRGSIA